MSIDTYRIAWTGVAAYIRRNAPARRLRPNEFTWLHDQAREVYSLYIERGWKHIEAADMAKSAILVTIISGERP